MCDQYLKVYDVLVKRDTLDVHDTTLFVCTLLIRVLFTVQLIHRCLAPRPVHARRTTGTLGRFMLLLEGLGENTLKHAYAGSQSTSWVVLWCPTPPGVGMHILRVFEV